MYESITTWRDLEDNHLYRTGEKFPHDGREISEARIAELSGTQNKAGFALIRPCATPSEETSVEAPAEPKKTTRGRKKTT